MAILLVLTITAPVEKEVFNLSSINWDSDRFSQRFLYEYRPEFQALVQAIIAENLPDASIIGANVPGLEFFVQQPVVDLIWWGLPAIPALFTEENVTSGLELLNDLNTYFLIGLKEKIPFMKSFNQKLSLRRISITWSTMTDISDVFSLMKNSFSIV